MTPVQKNVIKAAHQYWEEKLSEQMQKKSKSKHNI